MSNPATETPNYEGEQRANRMTQQMIARDEHCTLASAKRVCVVDNNGVPITGQSKISVYGSSVVGASATTVLATYTVPANKRFTLIGGFIGGNEAGEFTFEIASTVQALIRNSGSVRTIVAEFPIEPEASAGAVVEVKVTNISNKAKQFEATLSGYTVDV